MTQLQTAAAIALIALLTPTASAQDPGKTAKDADGPRLFLKTKEIDFGLIMHGTKAHMTLELENRGTEELLIKHVKPSCGCTVARYPKSLAPGAKGVLALTFDSNEKPAGYQSFRIAIYTNDPTQRDRGGFCTMVAMRGEVKTLYRVAPHGAYFGEVIRGTTAQEKMVIITGRGDAKTGFTATLKDDVPDYIQVETEALPPTDRRKGVKVKIRLLPHLPYGQLDLRLAFQTNFTAQPIFRVPVTALVNRRIAGPPAVHFGPVPRGKGAERLVVIERRDKKEGISVAKVRFDEARLVVTTDLISARRLEAKVVVRKDAPPGAYAGEIEFFLDDPDQKIVVVPVYLRVEPQVRVYPTAALLPKGTKPGATFAVRLPEGAALSAATASGAMKATVEKQKGSWLISVQAPKSGEFPTRDATLTLTTTVPGEETTQIPLLAR